MSATPSLALAMLGSAALVGCGGASWMPPASYPEQALHPGVAVWDDLGAPDGAPPPGCTAGDGAWLGYGHIYCFEVHATASYRFELAPSFRGALQLQERDPEHPWYFPIAVAPAPAGDTTVVRVALDPGRYQVIVGDRRWDDLGTYRLRVDRDESHLALIGREDPARVAALVAAATALDPGGRAYGTYRSSPGGAHTSCGLVSGNAVHRLHLDHPARLHLQAAAHFPPAIEVRALPAGPAGAPFGCARAPKGTSHVELTVDLPAGDHLVVLDSLTIRRHYPLAETNGIIAGAYVIDAEVVR